MMFGRAVLNSRGEFDICDVFMIRRKDYINPHFFLLDWNYEQHEYVLTRWTSSKLRARKFISEEEVETFKSKHIRTDQPCEIIRI